MTRSKKNTSHSDRSSSRGSSDAQGFYTPFKNLDQHLRQNSRRPSHAKDAPDPPPATNSEAKEARASEDGVDLFLQAMSGVEPLPEGEKKRVAPIRSNKPAPRFLAQEELDAYAQLADLVAGDGAFELTYSDEYVDGAVVGLSPQILRKLRKGEFSYQDYVDLHRLNREEAKERVTGFVRQSFARSLRCILIVCGRGLNSVDKEPVLKNGLVQWLTRAPLKRMVLAFASARSYDGGAGAFYVLLRRNEAKGQFAVPAK